MVQLKKPTQFYYSSQRTEKETSELYVKSHTPKLVDFLVERRTLN